ncbi:hypothetical protein [Streptomyces sp. SID8352]|uniref:hypothetical protein n=1 Tax=Streptomyces sp. SID8352 TaxID=2690338 RepID=UPI0013686FD1|nr:hypothetical protein [Streptomyces sp. SID8352]MYU25242.1 hypothetical protein [Streptomyces sp. SID8352]
MSQYSSPPPMPPYGPPMPPPPPPPGRRPAVTTALVAGAAAVVAAVVAVVVTLGVTGDGRAEPAPTVTVTETVGPDAADGGDEGAGESGADTADDGPEGTEDTATADGVHALDDTVVYDSDIEVGLTGLERAVSTDSAVPENTPYIRFTVRLENKGDKPFDAPMLTVNCSYGEDGSSAEAVFDTAAGLNGGPETKLLAGRSLNVPWGCELPKGEKLVQIEITPDYDSEAAIFTGRIP